MAHEIRHVTEHVQSNASDRSLGDLFSELTRETTELVRQEVTLAKVELTQKAGKIGRDVGFLAAGGAVAYAGFLALIAAVILLIGNAIPMWVSALLVGLVVAGAGAYLVMQGLNNLKSESLAPTQTLDTLKEDARWAKEQTS